MIRVGPEIPGAALVGTEATEGPVPVTLDDIVRYAGASGDFTAVHWDPEVARRAGYDRLFAMGMLGAGRLGALVTRWFGAGAVEGLRARFRERAWVGDEVTYRATVVAADGGLLRVALAATSTGGVTLIDGEALVRHGS